MKFKPDQFVFQCDHRFGEQEATLKKAVVVTDDKGEWFKIIPLAYFCDGKWRSLNSQQSTSEWFATPAEATMHIRQKYCTDLVATELALTTILEKLDEH